MNGGRKMGRNAKFPYQTALKYPGLGQPNCRVLSNDASGNRDESFNQLGIELFPSGWPAPRLDAEHPAT